MFRLRHEREAAGPSRRFGMHKFGRQMSAVRTNGGIFMRIAVMLLSLVLVVIIGFQAFTPTD